MRSAVATLSVLFVIILGSVLLGTDQVHLIGHLRGG